MSQIKDQDAESQKQKQQLKETEWCNDHERLLLTWCERASGYAWLHSQSHTYYKKWSSYISIPSGILSYIAGGTTLLTSDSFTTLWVRGFIGVCGVLAGVLTSFQQTSNYKELSEQHRISSLRFLSFYRDINTELKLTPNQRTSVVEYITMKRLELDKMLEQSPHIPEKIIARFNEYFKNNLVYKPQLANELQTFVPYGWSDQHVFDFNVDKKLSITAGKAKANVSDSAKPTTKESIINDTMTKIAEKDDGKHKDTDYRKSLVKFILSMRDKNGDDQTRDVKIKKHTKKRPRKVPKHRGMGYSLGSTPQLPDSDDSNDDSNDDSDNNINDIRDSNINKWNEQYLTRSRTVSEDDIEAQRHTRRQNYKILGALPEFSGPYNIINMENEIVADKVDVKIRDDDETSP